MYLVILSLVVSFAAIGVVYQGVQALQEPIGIQEAAVFEVRKGDTLRSVTQRLEGEGVINSGFWFYWIGRFKEQGRLLKAGEYWLSPEYTAMGLFPVLTSGKTVNYSITFIEGWNIREVLAELDNHPKLERVLNSKDPAEVASQLGMEYPHAEGLIFPDTYFYRKGMSDLDILQQAYRKTMEVLSKEWKQRSSDAIVKSPYEALILASIVERETSVDSEREVISGVFTERLRLKMRLQTDPTVIYGLGEAYQGNITRKHLKQPTPYNTYVIKGLPPTPISMPGEASIKAALNPDITGDLYFVAKGDGTHAFSKTLREHTNAVRAYQLKRRSDYRSSQ
ncbi:endolytic transglycosylase MltG [Hahella ganghwensis]|uniref:endolytic transglycosylase MltG n=1 Tax=Hahella ganghwensis TaxID=286420 RepID=UPI00037B93A3|nr:endolytic transglycosylase MltG [Hahella ganghwensis]